MKSTVSDDNIPSMQYWPFNIHAFIECLLCAKESVRRWVDIDEPADHAAANDGCYEHTLKKSYDAKSKPPVKFDVLDSAENTHTHGFWEGDFFLFFLSFFNLCLQISLFLLISLTSLRCPTLL